MLSVRMMVRLEGLGRYVCTLRDKREAEILKLSVLERCAAQIERARKIRKGES